MAFYFADSQWFLKSGASERPLIDLARQQSQPFYLYDLDEAARRARAFVSSGLQVHYAMKANSFPRLLQLFAREGLGVDVVSLGELKKALENGFSPSKIIYSGLGKGHEELEFALGKRIHQINVESFEELQLIEELSRAMNLKAEVALRLNIHLAAPTHKNIQTATEESKFGIDIRQLPEVLTWLKTAKNCHLVGLATHVGSQITDISVFRTVSQRMGEIYREVRGQGFALRTLDLGGGLGLDYHSSGERDLEILPDYFAAIGGHNTEARVVIEPGRFLVARAGVLIAKVVHVKRGINRQFVILNAGMNALMRPALYQAYHRIEPLVHRSGAKEVYTICGPLCEGTDIFAEQREVSPLKSGDWIGIFDTGAYGAVMANNYNEMPRPPELALFDGRLEAQ